MKQIIPFSKDITFKTKIGDITGIELENDLILKGEDLITGNFYIKGTYKMLKTSSLEEEYSYKIPCDIAISSSYDAFNATISIDNFTFEIINEEILRINVDLLIDNLEKKEEIITPIEEKVEETKEKQIEQIKSVEQEKVEEKKSLPAENTLRESTQESDYKTYCVYLVREGDTIEKIANTYKVTINDIEAYNDINNFSIGLKLVIPSVND